MLLGVLHLRFQSRFLGLKEGVRPSWVLGSLGTLRMVLRVEYGKCELSNCAQFSSVPPTVVCDCNERGLD